MTTHVSKRFHWKLISKWIYNTEKDKVKQPHSMSTSRKVYRLVWCKTWYVVFKRSHNVMRVFKIEREWKPTLIRDVHNTDIGMLLLNVILYVQGDWWRKLLNRHTWSIKVVCNVQKYILNIIVSMVSRFVSCGNVALDGLFINFFFLADHRATDFTLSKICGTSTKNTSHLSTVIFTTKRFVRAESCG